MKRPFLIYPFLFALFPMLSMFSHNAGEVSVTEMFLPAMALLTLTTTLLVVFRLILGDIIKAAIMVVVFLVPSMSYMHVYQLLDWEIAGFTIGRHRNLMPILVILLSCCTYFIRRTQRNLIDFTRVLNVLGLVLLMIPLVTFGYHKFKTNNSMWDPKAIEDIGTVQQLSATPENLRDIYYIILDRYTDADTLKRVWNYDNKEFLDYLRNRGFYVAAESRSNYLKTAHSLASSLNVQFINFLGEQVGEESDDWLPLYQMLEDYKVQRFLKKKGYKYLHFGSWWGPTSENMHADMNFKLRRLPEFSSTLFRSTIFYPIGIELGMFDHREEIYKRVLYKFDELGKIPEMNEPTFVFAHMIIPHPPFVFDRYGNFLTEDEVNKKNLKENYIDQLLFTNRKVKALIDKLLSDSEIPPIIILQGDEGTAPERFRRAGKDFKRFNWKQATDAELKEKVSILNAYYFPGTDNNALYPSITPVNSFRLVFNLYFDTNLKLLSDESYAFVDEYHLYSFFDVTDKITKSQ